MRCDVQKLHCTFFLSPIIPFALLPFLVNEGIHSSVRRILPVALHVILPTFFWLTTNVIKIFRTLVRREARCAVINGNRTVIRLTLRDSMKKLTMQLLHAPPFSQLFLSPSGCCAKRKFQSFFAPRLYPIHIICIHVTLMVCETAYRHEHQRQCRLHKYGPIERPRKNGHRFIGRMLIKM